MCIRDRTSPKMDLPHMSKAARIKGVDILGTGDCLYRPWLDELESNLEQVGDRYENNGVAYIIQAEVETTIGGRIHHLLFLSLIHISEPTRLLSISYAVFCLKKK